MTSSNARRFTIGAVMAVVFLIAVDIGFFREFGNSSGPEFEIALVTFPAANVLLLALPSLWQDRASRPFWIAFQAVGWTMVVILGVFASSEDRWLFWPITILDDAGWIPDDTIRFSVMLPSALIGYMTPSLLLALLAGRLSSRYRVVIERRPEKVDDENAADRPEGIS